MNEDLIALIEHLRAFVRLAFPEEMTPQAKRILEQILDRHDPRVPA